MNIEFESLPVNLKQLAAISTSALAFNDLLDILKKNCPISREFSLCKTKLEEAYYFANRSILLDEFPKTQNLLRRNK